MKGTVITIALFLIVAHMLLLSGITDDVAGDSLDDFEGGVSENLPTDKDFNALAIGNLNGDEHLDIAFGGEDYGGANTQGLYAYAGNGGGSWTASYNGLPSEDSWGGLALGDADGDGKMELYAGNEGWGSHGGSVKGVGTWEYSGGSWSTSGRVLVTSPYKNSERSEASQLHKGTGTGCGPHHLNWGRRRDQGLLRKRLISDQLDGKLGRTSHIRRIHRDRCQGPEQRRPSRHCHGEIPQLRSIHFHPELRRERLDRLHDHPSKQCQERGHARCDHRGLQQ